MAERRGRSALAPSSSNLVPGTPGERAAKLSNQMVGLVNRYAGRGPTKCRVTISTDFVLVVLEDLLTRGEQNLVAAGQTDAVEAMRHRFHDLMAEEAMRLVETDLGMTVSSYLRDCDPEANCAVLVFLLDTLAKTRYMEIGDS